MSDIANWIQDNWFELGSLLAQFAIVGVLVRYGRIAVRLRAASQGQAQPKLRIVETEDAYAPAEATPAGHGGVGRMLSPMPEAPAPQAEPIAPRRAKQVAPWRVIVAWLQAPMGAPSHHVSGPIS